jgi:hypothetical protein
MQRKQQVGEFWVCVIFFACVCVGSSDMTTMSEGPSSSVRCVMCIGCFPQGVLGGGGRYAPPGYAQRSGQRPEIVFGVVFSIFSSFVN